MQASQTRSLHKCRWEALLVVMDALPFSRLPAILADINDDRLWVFAELMGDKYTPKNGGSWAPNYHGEATMQGYCICASMLHKRRYEERVCK